MITLAAEIAIAAKDKIGEGPAWDAARARLIWVDHGADVIHAAQESGGVWREMQRWTIGRHVGSALPRAAGGMVVASGDEILLMDEAGALSPFVRLDIDTSYSRINDIKCDPQGRIWAGALAFDFSPRGRLYRIDPDRTVTCVMDGLKLPNGLDWSRDGRTFYFTDSLKGTVDAYDFDMTAGTVANGRMLTEIKPPDGLPNGMTIDDEDCLWVAQTTGGQVCRYGRDGRKLARIMIDVSGVTSCGFAGDRLFISSRSGRVPEVVRELGVPEAMMESDGPGAGALYMCRPGVTGPAATPFAM